MKKRRAYQKLILTAISVLFVGFIFSNSLFSGEVSSGKSKALLQWLQNFFDSLGIPFGFTEHFLRKLGHFSEYFVLGCLLAVTIRQYRPKQSFGIFIELFLLSFLPVVDELIQLFVPGRGSSVADVLLDFCGGTVGMAIALLILWQHRRRRLRALLSVGENPG